MRLTVYHVKLCAVGLVIYTVFSVIVFLKIRARKELLNCHSGNSSNHELHRKFRNRAEKFLSDVPSNPVTITIDHSGTWRKLHKYIYVYSAFIDDCRGIDYMSPYCIKFVGITLSSLADPSHIQCAFKNNNIVVKNRFTHIEKVSESHFKSYTAAYFYCSIQNVSIQYASLYVNESNITWINVQSIKYHHTSKDVYLNACIRPFYGTISFVSLAEFLTFYSVMGVDHFFLYYTETFKNLQSLANLLKNSNVNFTLLKWNIPLDNEHLHEYGQIAFNQDCLSRSRFRFSHTIVVDVDEFMVPAKGQSLKEFIKDVDHLYENAGSYIVQSAYFCDEYPVLFYSPLHIVMFQYRQSTAWEHYYRSKYIIKPERVQHAGIHKVWRYEPGMREVLLPEAVILLHHYKSCCGLTQEWFRHLLEFNVLEDNYVIDNSIFQIRNRIYNHTVIKFIINNIFEPNNVNESMLLVE